MARDLLVRILGDASSLEKTFKRSERSAAQFKKKLTGTFTGGLTGRGFAALSAGLLGGAGVVAGMKGVIDAASDMNEQMSKTDVVFGDSAKAIEEWSKKSATAMGLSRREALATASSFGALFQPLGIVGDEATKQAEGLTQLGADLASFYNTDVQSALDAIRSGLVGESEPLRKYGALLSETRVQQEALTETGKKNAAQLTDQDKVLARIALIYKDTSQAQGDFARTSGGLANQQRILRANLDNLRTVLGQAFLPMVTRAIKSFNAWITQSKNQKQVLDIVKQVAGALTAVLKTLKGVFDGLNAITGSTKRTLELLLIAFLAFKTAKLIKTFTDIAGSVGLIGQKAEKSTGQVKGFQGKLKNLAGIGTITLTVGVVFEILNTPQAKKARDQVEDWLGPLGFLARPGTEGIGKLIDKVRGGGTARAAASTTTTKTTPPAIAPTMKTVAADATAAAVASEEAKKAAERLAKNQEQFDSFITRALNFVQDAPLRGQLERLKIISGLLTDRIKVTKDITRKRELEDQVLQILRDRNQVTQQINQQMLDTLSFNVEKTGATKALQDDIAALRRYEAGIKAVIAAEGNTLDRQQQLFQVRQQRIGLQREMRKQAVEDAKTAAQAAKDAAQAAQFRALGFTGTGEEKIPTAKALAKRLGKLSQAIQGTPLDSKAWKAFVDRIRRVLSGNLGSLGRDVRDRIKQMLDEWAAQLEQADPVRRRRGFLDPGFGHGFNPVGAGGATGSGIVINGGLHLSGIQDVRQLENELISRSNARPQPRRGP